MSRPKVLVTRHVPEPGIDRLRESCDVDLRDGLDHGELLEAAAETEGLLCLLSDRIDAELLAAAPRLKVVANYAVGVNNIDLDACGRRGVAVGNTPDVLTEATADLAMTLLLAAARRLVPADRFARSGRWTGWMPLGFRGLDLVGQTVGVFGMGRIGRAFARRCRFGWDMRVIYHNRGRDTQAEADLGAEFVDFDTLLAESDFLSLHCPLNDASRGRFGAAEFARMKRTAVLVNTARGPVVVQDDLVAALRDGAIHSAGLDVTDPEPPAADDPLLALDNLVLAPHIGSATTSVRDKMSLICADNILAGLADEPLRCPVPT